MDRRFPALDDSEDEIDAIVAAVDDFRRHADFVTADAAVGFDDTVDVGLHGRPLQRAASPGLYRCGKICVLDPVVALKDDAVEHSCFDYMHDPSVALALNCNVVEQ